MRIKLALLAAFLVILGLGLRLEADTHRFKVARITGQSVSWILEGYTRAGMQRLSAISNPEKI